MKAFLELVVRQLVDDSDHVILREEATVNSRCFVFVLPRSEVGKVIGKQGHTIQVIRSLLVGADRLGQNYRFEVEELGKE